MVKIKSYMFLWCIAFLIGGCSAKTMTTSISDTEVLPDYRPLLQLDSLSSSGSQEDNGEGQIPSVRIYMDNTGSMQAFIFDETMKCQADPKFVRLMRAFRDMERIFSETSYYTIHQNEHTDEIRDWLEYEGSVYQDFEKPEFYFSWKNNDKDGNNNGPLSLLYLDKGNLDPKCINIVMTDLAEQNVNNTQLAHQVHQMCSENRCDAYMLAFQFDYHGNAEVADPDRLNEIISKRIDGPRPYYVIFTGPSQVMDRYMEQFLTSLESLDLKEGTDFYLAESKLEWDESILNKEEILFQNTASYDDIKQEIETGEISELSKNISSYEEPKTLFDEESDDGLFAFYYHKEKSLSKKQNDWRLNFQIPLSNQGKNTAIQYNIDQAYYILVPETNEEPDKEAEESHADDSDTKETGLEISETKTAGLKWKQIEKPIFTEEIQIIPDNNTDGSRKACSVKLSGKPDKDLESDALLMILTITQEEESLYEEPDWVDSFDTGWGDDYFQRTYNLSGFYDVMFGSGYLTTNDGKLISRHIYAQIPILITGLKGEQR